jgi:lauroyl/myristoyl acyltransferase
VAYGVTLGYFLFRPARVRASMDLYRALFPERGRLFHRYAAWRQFADFTAGYCDRLELERSGEIRRTDEGWHRIEEAARAGRGGILLVSHFGNPEIGARLFRKRGLPMLMVMGERDPREVARQQREAMKRDGLDVQVSSQGTATPFDGLEALQALNRGDLVGMAGDLAWGEQARLVEAPLLGRTIRLPEAPHAFALLTGVPLLTVWIFRTGRAAYHLRVDEPRHVTASSRKERPEAIRASVRLYAQDLEAALKRHPWQWHVFEPLLD